MGFGLPSLAAPFKRLPEDLGPHFAMVGPPAKRIHIRVAELWTSAQELRTPAYFGPPVGPTVGPPAKRIPIRVARFRTCAEELRTLADPLSDPLADPLRSEFLLGLQDFGLRPKNVGPHRTPCRTPCKENLYEGCHISQCRTPEPV